MLDNMATDIQQPANEPRPTDRQILNAMFNLIGALARELTGKMPLVCVQEDDGSFSHYWPQTGHVSWLSPKLEEFVDQNGRPRVRTSMRCPLHSPPDDKPSSILQTPSHSEAH